jgi:REP element-mobilizing transposase RayT
MGTKQLTLNLSKGGRGGRRPGSGRPRIHSKGVGHRRRERVSGKVPMHINFKYKALIRNKQCLKLLKKAIVNARSHGLRIVQFSLQSNHVHLIVEAENNKTLTKGMRSLTVTMAKGIAKGRVQLERYHLHVLRSIRETKNAVKYVLFNQQKHEKGTCSKVDEYSSLLSNTTCLEWISSFAKFGKMTLTIGQRENWLQDKERSYLLKIAMAGLFTKS